MWWRLTKTIIISWLVGVVCGAGIVLVLQREDPIPPAASPGNRSATPQTTERAPASPDAVDR
jgi:hypothetical protein